MKDKLDAKSMTNSDWADLKAESIPVRQTDRHFIPTQKLIDTKGTPGAYERWVDGHRGTRPKNYGRQKDKGAMQSPLIMEDVRANPDSLIADEAMYVNSQPTDEQFIMGSAIEHLQGLQKRVYLLTFREGLSLAKAAKRLGISKSDAQGYRNRAIKFLQQYCKTVSENE